MTNCLEKIIRGDTKAIYEFYKIYAPKILKYTSKRLPAKEDAQEITQDIFLEAIDSLPLLKAKTKVLNWLYRIAHHKVVDFYRKRKIKTILLSKMPFLELVGLEIDQPEFQYEKNRIRDKIEKAFHNLPANYRKILLLHYEQQISVKKLTPIFNLSLKATESLLFRARMSFKKAYERT